MINTAEVLNRIEKFPMLMLNFFSLDTNKMSIYDQFAYMGVIADMLEKMDQFTKKYGPSEEEMKEKYDKLMAGQELQKMMSLLYIKDNAVIPDEDKEEDDE